MAAAAQRIEGAVQKIKKIAGLSIRQYILWKLLHSALAAVIFRLLGVLG